MHPQRQQIFLIFIQAALLSLSSCQKDDEYATCFNSFQCGRLTNLSYPFWGGTRSLSCGYPGFQLNCGHDIPLLNISSLSYRVLDIDFITYTLRVARQDIWNNMCPHILRNTTLDPTYFEFSPDSGDRNITLYYDCSARPRAGQQISLLNQFSCDADNVTTMNIFSMSSRGPGSSITCASNISVRVNRTAAAALENPTVTSLRVLQEALASGFSVQWSADNGNCLSCRQTAGTCAYNQDTGASVCRKANEAGIVVGLEPPRSPIVQNEPPAGTFMMIK